MSTRARVSEREFLARPESMGLVELVDGEIIEAPSPSFWHQEVLSRLVMALRAWAQIAPSPNRTYDRVTKRFLYAEAGVSEYWLVDPAGVVERRSQAGLMRLEEFAARMTTPLLPGFSLDVAALFA